MPLAAPDNQPQKRGQAIATAFALAGPLTSRSFAAGAEIASPNKPFASLYLLTRGWAFTSRTHSDGRRQILKFIFAGDLIGLDSALLAAVPTVCQAITDVDALSLPASRVHEIIATDHRLAEALLRASAAESSLMCEHLVSIGRRTAYERIVHLLLEIWTRLTRIGIAHGTSFTLPLTQELLADTLGLSVIHVNRTLQRVRSDRLFEIQAGAPMRVRILNLREATRIAGFETEYLRAE